MVERLGAAVDAGLMIIPPQEGRRAAVVAGDRVVGDHGSTSFCSAAAGRVTMLAATGLDELHPRPLVAGHHTEDRSGAVEGPDGRTDAPDRGVERPGGLHPADADPVIADVRTGPKSARNLLIVVPR